MLAFGSMSVGRGAYYTRHDKDFTDESDVEVIMTALELGLKIDTAPVYGIKRSSEKVVGKAIARYLSVAGNSRDQIFVSSKCGITDHGFDGEEQETRQSLEESLVNLNIDYLDILFLHRVDPQTSVTVFARTCKALIAEGKIRAYGLSEASAEQLNQCYSICNQLWVQSEYSLITRDAEASVLPLCKKLGIGFLAYSALGRGLLSGRWEPTAATDYLLADDWRLAGCPRFSPGNFQHNVKTINAVLLPVAEEAGCAPAQVALAWLLHRGVTVLMGSSKKNNIVSNSECAKVKLTAQQMARLDSIAADIKGERYSEGAMSSVHM